MKTSSTDDDYWRISLRLQNSLIKALEEGHEDEALALIQNPRLDAGEA
jgi:hypothetical protein